MNDEHKLTEIERELLALRPAEPREHIRRQVGDRLQRTAVSPTVSTRRQSHTHAIAILSTVIFSTVAAVALIAALGWLLWPTANEERVEDAGETQQQQGAPRDLPDTVVPQQDSPRPESVAMDDTAAYVPPTWHSLAQALISSPQATSKSPDDAPWLPPIPPLRNSVVPRYSLGGGF